jgi:hypothetical protein
MQSEEAKLGGEGGMDCVRVRPGPGFYSRDDAPSQAWLRGGAFLKTSRAKGQWEARSTS